MSVYSRGDKKDDDKKDDPGKKIGNALEQVGKDLSKNFSNLFGGKDKRWKEKGGGHTLGTAADAEAARQARLAALDAGPSCSSSGPAPSPRAQAPPSAAASAAVAAAEARAAGGGGGNRAPRVMAGGNTPRAGDGHALGSGGGSAAFPGPGHRAAPPEAAYAAQIQMLCEMGFERAAATAAIASSHGDVEQAVTVLSAGGGGAGGSSAAAGVEAEVGTASAFCVEAAAEVCRAMLALEKMSEQIHTHRVGGADDAADDKSVRDSLCRGSAALASLSLSGIDAAFATDSEHLDEGEQAQPQLHFKVERPMTRHMKQIMEEVKGRYQAREQQVGQADVHSQPASLGSGKRSSLRSRKRPSVQLKGLLTRSGKRSFDARQLEAANSRRFAQLMAFAL